MDDRPGGPARDHCSLRNPRHCSVTAAIPSLVGRLSRTGKQVAVHCRHCRGNHWHGAVGIVDGTNPHRLAHCHKPGSPYVDAGYFVSLPVQGGQDGR